MLEIVSGAQTGVDRAALDAALEQGTPAGGWCPAGRLAEDGTIPDRYPVTELPGAGYLQRTRQNVIDSDGTLIIHFGPLSGGTRKTQRFCREQQRPHLLIDAAECTQEMAVDQAFAFITHHRIEKLNVAGPRASGDPRAYPCTKAIILGILEKTL